MKKRGDRMHQKNRPEQRMPCHYFDFEIAQSGSARFAVMRGVAASGMQLHLVSFSVPTFNSPLATAALCTHVFRLRSCRL